MLENIYNRFRADKFATEILKININSINEGRAKASLQVRKEHLNGVELCQGGVIYSLADFTCAMAANSYGPVCVSVENSIIYKRAVRNEEIMIADAEVVSRNNRIVECECVITVNYEIRAIMKSKLLSEKTQ
ncbi:MAG TPA: PaaI family thioesterase [Clostridia bacterium]|jgi:acyl-CoA thioesterase|nr:MAG: Acyl-coenzyme A thioesterase PaaI [Firmicutes bacterium ADurb.Bin146]HOD92485.1 PaaI family thioesterase [Clostridia bacterium]HQM38842.1 PaaI family thioesterase [Clostridia bacterium]